MSVAISEKWMEKGSGTGWHVHVEGVSEIQKYLKREKPTQLLFTMNNITNGTVVSYAYRGERFKSGKATVILGGKRDRSRVTDNLVN